MGDVESLQKSIKEVGLLNPIAVNESMELISGFRRLDACRRLGWEEIEVVIIRTGRDRVKELDLEYHENIGRSDLTTDEYQSYIDRRNVLLKPPGRGSRIWSWIKRLGDFIKRLYVRIRRQFFDA
jgi:ParB family chromosome partitioning protein